MADLSLETVFTSPRFFGIENATPVQRAVCRIAEGLPLGELACDDQVVEAVGGDEAIAVLAGGDFRPRELDLLCAIRSGKSFFVAAHQFWSAMTARVAHLKPGEIPRHPVLSVNLRSAEATFNILAGTIAARSVMRPLLVGDVGADSLLLKHPSGRPIECSVAAGARAGANLVSVWLTGAAFEEYARQAGESSGATVNYDEQLRAAAGRVVEGGQILSVSSPWAPFGPAYERFMGHYGKPSPERVVIKATGPMMNPSWWTPARCEALQRSNPTAYITDVLAGFADQATSLIPAADIRRATREGVTRLPREAGVSYVAAMDPATRGNAWTLVVAAHEDRGDETRRVRVARAMQWQGSAVAPLRPDDVLEEIAAVLREFGLTEVHTDQLASDFIVVIAGRYGLTVEIETTTAASKLEMAESLRARIADGAVELLDVPALLADLQGARKLVTRNGVAIDLPRTADGRHCDFFPATALAVAKGGADAGGLPDWAKEGFREGAEQFIGQWNAFGDFGKREKKSPPVVVTTQLDGTSEAFGNPPAFPRQMRARWARGEQVRFSDGATPAFQEAVAKYRRENPNVG